MFLDKFAGCCSARMLKHQTHLRDIRDHRQSLLFRDKTRRRIDHGSGDPAGQRRAQTLGAAPDLYERHILARCHTDPSQSKSRDSIRGRTESADRNRAAFKLFGGFDAGLPHQDIVQRGDPGRDKNRV